MNTYVEMSDTTSESTSTRMPTFDGEKESWAYYKVKMESYLVFSVKYSKHIFSRAVSKLNLPCDELCILKLNIWISVS